MDVNYVLNSFVKKPAVQIVAFFLFVCLVVGLTSWIQGSRYDKRRAEYEAKEQAWQVERNKLIGAAEEKEKRIAELEPQVQAFNAAADVGKKVDEQLANEIERIAKESANAESNAQVPVDCRIRAERICTLFRATDKRFDCKPIFDECSGQ